MDQAEERGGGKVYDVPKGYMFYVAVVASDTN